VDPLGGVPDEHDRHGNQVLLCTIPAADV